MLQEETPTANACQEMHSIFLLWDLSASRFCHLPHSAHPFPCGSCWPRSDTGLTKSDLLPTIFLQSNVIAQPQKHDVRKSTLCAWQPGWSSLTPVSLPRKLALISMRGTRNTEVLIQHAKPQHLPLLIFFFLFFVCFFFNTTWFYCIYSLFSHARSWPCSTVSHMWLNAPQVKVLPQKSVLKNDPTLQSLASEAVELYRHDTWSVYCFTDVTWKYSFQDAPNSPVFLDSPTFQLWIT